MVGNIVRTKDMGVKDEGRAFRDVGFVIGGFGHRQLFLRGNWYVAV
jgi:hypothetical protein